MTTTVNTNTVNTNTVNSVYVNFLLHHYDEGGYQLPGDYTLPGERRAIADIIHSLMSAEHEPVEDGFAASSAVRGAIFWFKGQQHIIVLRDGIWVVGRMPEGVRVPRSNCGYYYIPEPPDQGEVDYFDLPKIYGIFSD